MNTVDYIRQVRRLIEEEVFRYKGEDVHEHQIRAILELITEDFLKNYEAQRQHISALLTIYEDYAEHILPLMLSVFINGLEKLKSLSITKLDLSFWDIDFNEQVVSAEYTAFAKSIMKRNQGVRLSEPPVITIDEKTAGNYLRILHRMVGHISYKADLDAEDINAFLIQLWIARGIAIATNKREFFYFFVSIFFDGLYFNQHYQASRDLSEECMICSYQDGMPEYGYFLSFRVFGNTSSSVSALHYANTCLRAFFKKGTIIDYVLKNMYWEGIKFCRNIHMIPFAIEIFENRPFNIEYNSYEHHKFHHAYYSSMLFMRSPELPELALSFIEIHKEEMMSIGQHEILPWLTLLFSIQKNYKPEDYDENQFLRYVNLFKLVVKKDKWERIHNTLFGTLKETTKELKEALVKLSYTRNYSDFVTDNKVALQVSHTNVLESFREQNVESYLLSMILQSDFSIVFKDKDSHPLFSVKEAFSSRKFDNEYYSPEYLVEFVRQLNDVSILWLGTDNHEVLPLYFDGKDFHFLADKKRKVSDVVRFYMENSGELPHDDRTKGRMQMDKSYEDYQNEEKILRGQINCFELPIEPTQTFLIIKDIELSNFPHNLITSENDFFIKSVPVCNIMSLEWLIENISTKTEFPKSIEMWIPIDSGDFALLQMHSKMEDIFKRYLIRQHHSILPLQPLQSAINILVAHGAEKISTFPAFYLSNATTTFSIKSFDNIVEKGQILILFVCHSGSQTAEFFRNQISTVVKQFLQSGYSAVIAPFWALNISIPPIWLDKFLESLKMGKDVGTAAFDANKKVCSIYNTPKAYSCLHFYGNPFVKLSL
jgi:hypothetical protein